MQKKVGVYIVTEKGVINGRSGAAEHISVGMESLARHFEMKLVPLFSYESEAPRTLNHSAAILPSQSSGFTKRIKRSALAGGVKDVIVLMRNNLSLFRYYSIVKSIRPDFIYERSNYLDFRGLLIARLLNIPHFYENNGIAALQYNTYYYKSVLYQFTLWLEKKMYDKSDYVFYTGTWGEFFRSGRNNWMNIENGVDSGFLKSFANIKRKPLVQRKIVIGFVGRLMTHHGPEIFINAIKEIKNPNKLKIVLIGSKLDDLYMELSKYVECENKGFVERKNLKEALQDIDIGIIPGAAEYPSHMKLFDYAAAKCLVICPDTYNLKYWFTDNELEFFKKGDVESLRSTIERLIDNHGQIVSKGEALNQKVSQEFTWDRIFEIISDKINSKLRQVS